MSLSLSLSLSTFFAAFLLVLDKLLLLRVLHSLCVSSQRRLARACKKSGEKFSLALKSGERHFFPYPSLSANEGSALF